MNWGGGRTRAKIDTDVPVCMNIPVFEWNNTESPFHVSFFTILIQYSRFSRIDPMDCDHFPARIFLELADFQDSDFSHNENSTTRVCIFFIS